MTNKDENKVRGNWDHKAEYLLSLAGYAIGIGNVWRFPYLCYRNGGGAFLFPYIVMLFIVGLPLFLLETGVGQFSSSGCLSLYNVCPIFKGNGYTSILVSLIASTYYSVVVAYPLVFLYNSFSSSVPWASCGNSWNTINCVEVADLSSTGNSTGFVTSADEFFHNHILQISGDIAEPNGLVWPIVIATLIVWTVVFLTIFKGVKAVGKVVWLTTTFPFVMLFALFFRGVTLPGAWDGIAYYIYPDFEKLTHLKVWTEAAVQIFFSLGPGFGCVITMSSFNKFQNNCLRDALFVPFLNCATSIFAGFVVFSVIGFMAHQTGMTVDTVVTAGPALAFITYPEALSLMPLAPLWSVLFFLMLFFLGIDSVFVQIEAMVVSFIDEFPSQRKNKSLITFGSCLLMFLLSLFCCSRGGMYVLQILDTYSATVPIILVCLCEITVFAYIYGSGKVVRDMEMMTQKTVSIFWYLMWLVVTPVILLFIFLNTLNSIEPSSYKGFVFPPLSRELGWLSALISMAAIPGYAIYYLLSSPVPISKRLVSAFTATAAWGPALESHRAAWTEYIMLRPLRHRLLYQKKVDFVGKSFPLDAVPSNGEAAVPLTNV